MLLALAEHVESAFVPDDHRTASTPGARVDALEITGGEIVILNGHGKPTDLRVERWALGDSPRPIHVA